MKRPTSLRMEGIGSVTLSDIGQSPYRFEIRYLPEAIVASYRYTARARLTHQEPLLVTSDQTYPVITSRNPTEAHPVVKQFGAQHPASTPGADRNKLRDL